MREVSGPIIAIALVLCAVFVPMAFISGLTGQFYRQFALTIAISTVISAINSLTLSPALAALLLKRHGAPKDALTRGMDRCSAGSSAASTASSARRERLRRRRAARDRRKALMMGVYAVLLGVTSGVFKRCRAASCRRRTSSTWSASRSCPTARRSTAPRT